MARLRDKPVADRANPAPAGLTPEQLLGPEQWARWQKQEQSGETVDYTDFFAKLDAIWADVSEEEWATIPHDLSINLDHYLYGSPKKDTLKDT